MKLTKLEWAVVGIFPTAAIILICKLIGDYFCLSKSDWASWVQAIGSIAAIAGAFLVGRHQGEIQMEVAAKERRDLLNDHYSTIKGVVDRAFQKCLNIEHYFRDDGPFGNLAFVISYSEDDFSSAIRLLTEAPIYELRSGELVEGILDLRDAMQSMQEWIQLHKVNSKTKNVEPEDPDFETDDDVLKEFLRSDMSRARNAYERVIAITGGEPRSKAQGRRR